MPRLNGRQCLEKIRRLQALSHIPVIIYTTSKLTQDKVVTKSLGADYFITKPSDLNKLRKELEFVFQDKWKR
jgi:DNA-binding response OmpR family regulator